MTTQTDTSTKKQYWLKNPPNIAIPLLKEMSVDAVSLANNHIMDYGPSGLRETAENLREHGIQFSGAGANARAASKPVYLRAKGQKLAFISFSNTFPKAFWAGDTRPGTAYGDPDRIRSVVSEAAENADRVLVSFHWGSESTLKPKGYQRRLARLAVDRGADVVFGHHPHSLQPIERYNDGLIFYSLGNYFFSTMSRDVEFGLLADVSFSPDVERPEFKMHLLRVNNYKVHYHPKLVKTFTNPLALAVHINRLDFIRLAEGTLLDPGPYRLNPSSSAASAIPTH
jgi:poly-gamma-glutamate synthesis protein (capsule biosynthesis protein)